MPLMYKKILVPIDGSESSYIAIQHAADLARITQGKVDLLHVVNIADRAQVYAHLDGAYLPDVYLEEFSSLGEDIMSEALSHISTDLLSQSLIRTGEPREFLQDFINREKYDLVVIGCRGLGALPGLFMGSVSQYLVQNANCPVMVVK